MNDERMSNQLMRGQNREKLSSVVFCGPYGISFSRLHPFLSFLEYQIEIIFILQTIL